MAEESRLVLVLGGARSGKSTFAEGLATRLAAARADAAGAAPPPAGAGRVTYLATAQAHDTEMRERIERHQAQRDDGWTTVECPVEVPAAVRDHAATTDVFLLDCVTFWVTNLLFASGGVGEQVPEGLGDFSREFLAPEVEAVAATRARAALDDLLAAVELSRATLVAVSNEVGLGLVPEYPLGRLYRDELGRANHRLAEAADAMYFLVAGLPLEIKALADASPAPPLPSSPVPDEERPS